MSSDSSSGVTGLKACANKPNCVSSVDARPSHHVDGFDVSKSIDSDWQAIRKIIASQQGASIVEESDGYLRAEFKSRFFGFTDDLEIQVSADKARFDVRSASRVGYSDLGVNRKRVEAIRLQLKKMSEIT